MPAPAVSVTLCMYNASRYIDQALASVFAQTFQDFEIIVIDDGSTDGSAERIARSYHDSRLTIVRQAHQTLRVARPAALAHSTGDLITFIDHDDVWLPQKLERQVAAAREWPDAALFFSNCWIIDASGARIGQLSDRYDFSAIDVAGANGHVELLARGNFVVYPTACVRAAAVRAIGGFNRDYQYVSDYDLWLRLARRDALHYTDEHLAEYRVHETQFTQRHIDITLPEHRALLEPIRRSASYPEPIRIALGDMLLGQHQVAVQELLRQHRYRPALRAAVGMLRYPSRVTDSIRHQHKGTLGGACLERGVAALLYLRDAIARSEHLLRRAAIRLRRVPRRMTRMLRREPKPRPTRAERARVHVWIDGTALGREQTGYFNLLAELIRRLARRDADPVAVHVVTDAAGRAALRHRIGSDAAEVTFHRAGWRTMHWSHVHAVLFGWPMHVLAAIASIALLAASIATASAMAAAVAIAVLAAQTVALLDEVAASVALAEGRPRHRLTARLIRFLWRRFPAPRRRAPRTQTIEVLFWRGRFRWRDSHRIAIVQDMTTRIHPELHTEGNIVEFEEFLGYLQRHAHAIATVSHSSRRDIAGGMAVCPGSVWVLPMPIHPQYWQPSFAPAVPATHGISGRYVLCVGTIEPRKNLRRLIKAMALLENEDAARGVTLVLAGQQGWDGGFRDFLSEHDAAAVKILGFVPGDHLPSLYHYASAVICPSLYEGFGLPVMEAMCCSGVVIASDTSSLPEVLGSDGILFDPRRIEAIAAALLRTLSMSPEESSRYRQRCRRRAEAHLSRIEREALLPGLAPEAIVQHA
jgi:glycosyltransferase involved in cell wall biosynthesis